MLRKTLAVIAVAAWAMVQAGQVWAADCGMPVGARLADLSGLAASASTDPMPPGTEICILESGPGCFGCESGYIHRCASGVWRPVPDERCGPGRSSGTLREDDRGSAAARSEYAMWPGGVDRSAQPPSGTVPFRHCRYFDRDGAELRVPPSEAAKARDLGLVAWQRCETFFCRLYGRAGEPLFYGGGDQDLVERDIDRGHISVRASECFADPRAASLDGRTYPR